MGSSETQAMTQLSATFLQSEQGEPKPVLAAVRQTQMDGTGYTTSPGPASPFLLGGVCLRAAEGCVKGV